MSVSEATAFEGNAEHFAGHALEVRGYVRYEVVHRNLTDYVSNGPLRIADVGGGSGIDAVWLAEMGHDITLVDPGEKQLARARARIAQATPEVCDRITLIEGDVLDVLRQGGEASFDMALSHGVAMYLPDPQSFTLQLARLVKPGGHVSLLEKSFFGQEARFVSHAKWDELDFLHATGRVRANNEGRPTRTFKPEDLSLMLKRAGVNPQRWFGVRVVSDELDMPVSALTPEQLEAVVEVELQQSRNDRTWANGQMLHFIGKKVSTKPT